MSKKRFPITEKQFYGWLEAEPRRSANTSIFRCPISECVLQLTNEVVESEDIPEKGPRWARGTADIIDLAYGVKWSARRGTILNYLKAAKSEGK